MPKLQHVGNTALANVTWDTWYKCQDNTQQLGLLFSFSSLFIMVFFPPHNFTHGCFYSLTSLKLSPLFSVFLLCFFSFLPEQLSSSLFFLMFLLPEIVRTPTKNDLKPICEIEATSLAVLY